MPKTKDGQDYERKVVELHPDTAERLERYLENSGRSFSHVTRQALQEFLNNHGYGPALEGWK